MRDWGEEEDAREGFCRPGWGFLRPDIWVVYFVFGIVYLVFLGSHTLHKLSNWWFKAVPFINHCNLFVNFSSSYQITGQSCQCHDMYNNWETCVWEFVKVKVVGTKTIFMPKLQRCLRVFKQWRRGISQAMICERGISWGFPRYHLEGSEWDISWANLPTSPRYHLSCWRHWNSQRELTSWQGLFLEPEHFMHVGAKHWLKCV